MQIYVEVDGEGREVLCDIEGEYELVAVVESEQYLVDDIWTNGTADQHQALHDQIDVAAAEYRAEIEEFQAESMRDDRIFNASNHLTS